MISSLLVVGGCLRVLLHNIYYGVVAWREQLIMVNCSLTLNKLQHFIPPLCIHSTPTTYAVGRQTDNPSSVTLSPPHDVRSRWNHRGCSECSFIIIDTTVKLNSPKVSTCEYYNDDSDSPRRVVGGIRMYTFPWGTPLLTVCLSIRPFPPDTMTDRQIGRGMNCGGWW